MYALTRDGGGSPSVSAYKYGATSPFLVITDGMKEPGSMAFDARGNLYVSDYLAGAILVYGQGETSLLRTITQGISHPGSIAISP
jgi:hypothetical protein